MLEQVNLYDIHTYKKKDENCVLRKCFPLFFFLSFLKRVSKKK